MNLDLSRRLATSTRPWSSTSPSTSSCRWCSARRWCTPTTSSSSRWSPSSAIAISFLHLTTYCRTVTLTVTTRTPTPALHLDSPAPPSGGKILFSQKVHRSTLELAASQKDRFLRPRNVANFAKVAIFVAVKMSKGRCQQNIFMPRNIVNRAHLTLGRSFLQISPAFVANFSKKKLTNCGQYRFFSSQLLFSTTTNCSFADSVIPFFLQLSRGGLRLTGENNQPKFMFKWNDKKTPISPKM